jgi:hypothetical protein
MAQWTQPPCPCCPPSAGVPNGCAATIKSQRTGPCLGTHAEHGDCKCYGTKADGGLCEDCYLDTK